MPDNGSQFPFRILAIIRGVRRGGRADLVKVIMMHRVNGCEC